MDKNKKDFENHASSLLKQKDMAKLLGLCPETICRWTRRGLIPCVRIGNRYLRYDPKEVIKHLASKKD